MASKTDIANLAISAHSGAWTQDIASAKGRTPDAINALWAVTLETALAAHPWKFAKGSWADQPALDAAENPDPDAGFAYRMPAECVRVFFLRPEIDFDEWAGGVITCSQGPALTMIGVRRDTDIGRFPATFNDYLAALLAYRICTPINASEAIRKRCLDDMATTLALAKSDNGRAGKVRRIVPDSFILERIGGARGSWLK